MRFRPVFFVPMVLILAIAAWGARAQMPGLYSYQLADELPPLAAVATLEARQPEASGGLLAIADECDLAVPITLTQSAPPYQQFSARYDTSSATTQPDDPVQSCTWGGAAANSRSVWWRLIAPEDGRLTVSTVSLQEGYDTVVTVYPATVGCNALAPSVESGCDDDTVGFHSRAQALVDAGEPYLIEITGWGTASPAGNLDLYIVHSPITRWQESHPSFIMSRHVVVSDGRYLYALGGWRPVAGQDATLRYEPQANTWSALAKMPQLYANTDGALVGDHIYVPSGYVSGTDVPYQGNHYRYSISGESWTTRAPMTGNTGLAEPLAWGAAAADPAGEAYYYVGGRYGTQPATPWPFVLRYDVPDDQWVELPPLPTARYGHRAAVLDGSLCVVGGIGPGGFPLASTECLDLASGSWSTVGELHIARYSFGSAVGTDGRWYVFGGSTGNLRTTAKTEVFDPLAGTWELGDQSWSLNQSRDWPAGARLGSDLYALGGYLPSVGLYGTVVDTLEQLTVRSPSSYRTLLPLVAHSYTASPFPVDEPNDAIRLAYGPLASGTPHWSDFYPGTDTEDFFYLVTPTTSTIQVQLTHIPNGANYDLFLYGRDPDSGLEKHLLASSVLGGNADEELQRANLPPGRYTIRVRNSWNRHINEQYRLLATY